MKIFHNLLHENHKLKRFFYILLILPWVLNFVSCGESQHNSNQISAEQDFSIKQEVVDSIADAYLQKMVKNEHFCGVALVIIKDKVVHAKAYGYASKNNINRLTTNFHIASLTKQFTAAAILQLAEKKIIDINKSINVYLPPEYNSHKWKSVTVHHLLNHTSGIADYSVSKDYYNVVDGFCLGNTVHGMVKEAMAKDLEFAPGAKFSYSNLGYTLLGLIIDYMSKIPYHKYLEVNILNPMGMYNSKIHIEGHIPFTNEAEGHRWSEDHKAFVPDDVVSLPVTEPDGGLVTTLTDFTKWLKIYIGKKQSVISKKSIKMMTNPYITIDENGIEGKKRSYGYGLIITDNYLSHSGYIVGFRSDFIVDTEKDHIIVIFTNNTANDPQLISTELFNIINTTN